MKQRNLIIAGFILSTAFTACNGDSSSSSTTKTDSTTVNQTGNTNVASNHDSMNNSSTNSNATTTTASKMPLSKADSTFVMKAAAGGMMEVQGGNLAQSNAMNDRVKSFGTMMVNDHSKANTELTSIAAAKGLTIPTDLPPAMKKHTDDMSKLKGKEFDNHYMTMMVTDHKEDIADFEKAAKSANDPDIKAFAAKTLPVLKMHLDSAQAIHKMKM